MCVWYLTFVKLKHNADLSITMYKVFTFEIIMALYSMKRRPDRLLIWFQSESLQYRRQLEQLPVTSIRSADPATFKFKFAVGAGNTATSADASGFCYTWKLLDKLLDAERNLVRNEIYLAVLPFARNLTNVMKIRSIPIFQVSLLS